MSESATHDAIEAVARDSYGRLAACIASRTRDIADAQDALSEALVAALENWPTNGLPDKPEAWLLQVVHNRLIDASRREQTRRDAEPFVLAQRCGWEGWEASLPSCSADCSFTSSAKAASDRRSA
jgi:RNA polymerase sigma-70 factor (ECF subfamily)